jgi:hypothetical protein
MMVVLRSKQIEESNSTFCSAGRLSRRKMSRGEAENRAVLMRQEQARRLRSLAKQADEPLNCRINTRKLCSFFSRPFRHAPAEFLFALDFALAPRTEIHIKAFLNCCVTYSSTHSLTTPYDTQTRHVEPIESNRILLAEESMRIVKDAPTQKNPKLQVFERELVFPVENEPMLAIVKYSPLGYKISDDKKVYTQFNLVNLSNAQLLSIPGEALPKIGYYLKKKMTGKYNFLLGLTNNGFGFILTKEDFGSFDRYNYVSETSLGEQTGGILVDAALDFIRATPKP